MRSTKLIPSYHFVIQYQSSLKTERYGFVQVVLLFPLTLAYQSMRYEADLKYGARDSTSGSLVFPRSKDEGAGRWATT